MDDLKELVAIYVFGLRVQLKAGDDKRDAGLLTPDTIQRDDNIRYDKIDKLQVLDVYRPKSLINKNKNLPVIVSVHGAHGSMEQKKIINFIV